MLGYVDLAPNSNYCYTFIKDKLRFDEAQEKCTEKSLGSLAGITSSEMQDIMDAERKKMGLKFIWIGLMKQSKYFNY